MLLVACNDLDYLCSSRIALKLMDLNYKSLYAEISERRKFMGGSIVIN